MCRIYESPRIERTQYIISKIECGTGNGFRATASQNKIELISDVDEQNKCKYYALGDPELEIYFNRNQFCNTVKDTGEIRILLCTLAFSSQINNLDMLW